MRLTRLKKYGKQNQSLRIILKMMLVGYLVLFSVSYVTSDTVAYFSGQQQVSHISITAGMWEDDSSDQSVLAFGDHDDYVIQTCPATIEVVIHNNGDGPMQIEAAYDIYYIETGDVKTDGKKLVLADEEGIITILEPGDIQTLSYDITASGHYQFVVHPQGSYSKEESIWSNEIIVDCESEETMEEIESEEGNAQDDPEKESQDEEKPAVEDGAEEDISEAEDAEINNEATEGLNDTNTTDNTDESPTDDNDSAESNDEMLENKKSDKDKTDEQNDASEENEAEDDLTNDDSTTDKESKQTDKKTKESAEVANTTREESEDVKKHDEEENNEMDE